MPRIVGGAARRAAAGRPAHGHPADADRAREALFNSLRGLLDLDGARVLDLFAGTRRGRPRGAVARRRGGRRSSSPTGRPRQSCGATSPRSGCPAPRCTARTGRAFLAVPRRRPEPASTSSSPTRPTPCPTTSSPTLLAALVAGDWLRRGADRRGRTVRARHADRAWPDVISRSRQRRYGEAMLWYGRRDDEPAPAREAAMSEAGAHRPPRGLPRLLRPGDQRAPRHHRPGRATSTTSSSSRCSSTSPSPSLFRVDERREMLDRGHRRLRQRRDRHLPGPGRRLLPRPTTSR